ncbi:MAG: hypothetical protein KDA99_02850, partial [Planctomycetales bacterium]|nr:hypothetical protein [Planctomycetales bacterium]
MTIEFACHQCDQRFRVADDKYGARLKCPKCASQLTVPSREIGATQIAVRNANRVRQHTHSVESPSSATVPPDATQGPPPLPVMSVTPAAIGSVAPNIDIHERAERALAIDPTRVSVPRRVIYAQGILLVVVPLITFALGTWFGLLLSRTADTAQAVAGPCEFTGRIVLLDDRMGTTADRGAVVLLVPQDDRPEQRLPVDRLKTGEPRLQPDELEFRALQVFGGGYDVADINGEFRVRLPVPGKYYLLVISRNATRPRHLAPTPQELAGIGRYFLPAIDLLGDQDYKWEPIE